MTVGDVLNRVAFNYDQGMSTHDAWKSLMLLVPGELFMRSMRFTALFVGLIEARTAKGEQPGDIMRFIAKTCCGPYAATPN